MEQVFERITKINDKGFQQGLHSYRFEVYEAILFDVSKWSRIV